MKQLLFISVLCSLNLFAQNEVKCGYALSVSKGTLLDSSSVKPQMTLEAETTLKAGATGELALLTEDPGFSMTYVIGKVRVTAVTEKQLTFEIIEKLGVITINGVERSNFKQGALVQFTEYIYDKPVLNETQWPSGAIKESGYMLCGHRMGEWKEFHENGASKTTYFTDQDGFPSGTYTEYHANGARAITGMYREGYKEGYWTEYFEDGKIKSQGYYRQGVKVGKWIEHDSNGKKVKRKYDYDIEMHPDHYSN